MKLQKMTLENFRAFKSAEISFEPDITVLVGGNGSGKSSALQGLLLPLQKIVNSYLYNEGSEAIDYNDFKLYSIQSSDNSLLSVKEFNIKVSFDILDFSYEVSESINAKFAINNKILIPDNVLASNYTHILRVNKPNKPIVVFYSADRAIDTSINLDALTADYNLSDPFLAYTDAFDAKTDFTEFLTWFKAREDLDNELFRLDGKEKYKNDAQLEAVRRSLSYFLEGFSTPHVKRSGKTALYLKKAEEVYSLNQLSDGEKNTFALVADIARRLAIANTEMENPLLGDGLVLIDEIDLHLHPNWQRKIIPNLRKAFPNVQFVVTTHSPQVLGEVDARCIRVLEAVNGNVAIYKSEGGIGFSSDEILELVMESTTKNKDALADYKALFDLIYKKDLEKANTKLAALKELYGETESVVKAATMLRLLK